MRLTHSLLLLLLLVQLQLPCDCQLLLRLVQGVHYDALEDDDVHGPPRRIFHPSDQSIASRALLAARRRQAARSFTNVSKFTLRCSDCQAGLVGAVEAQEHAKATGHANFEEYAK